MGAVTTTFVENVRANKWRMFDWQLFLYVMLLIGFGVVMGYSAGYGDGGASGMSQTVKTVIWSGIGLTIFFVAASIDYHWLTTFTVPLYLAVLGLLALTMAIGTSLFGAQMSVTVAGLDFQFSEVCKVLMIVVLASFLTGRRDRIGRLSTIVGAGVLMAIPTGLVFLQPDLGTALVFVAIVGGMLFMSGASIGWLGLLTGGAIAAAPLVIETFLHGYQRQRLFCFLDPQADPLGACYQLVQSLNAVGSGGWFGQGLTAGGLNRSGFLPVQSTDFIFTVVAEELGFVGGLIVLALFALLVWRIMVIAWSAGDALGSMVAIGLASMILFQLLVNVGMVIGIMPVTGIPLPFITYGGSSMISLLFGIGILQSVRMHSRKATF
ncbi:MAG TPA: rod shape-determining protein RodA [Candidatus Limnocylindria bacterium]|nr:rod shape-determining protein RodA [Candidatus Limnocylindria bacterium]